MKKATLIFSEESLLQAGVYQYGLIDVRRSLFLLKSEPCAPPAHRIIIPGPVRQQ